MTILGETMNEVHQLAAEIEHKQQRLAVLLGRADELIEETRRVNETQQAEVERIEGERRPEWSCPADIAREVVADAAARHGVTAEAIYGGSRRRDVTAAKYEAFHVLRTSGYTLADIGRYLHCDHTTVIYGLRRYQEKKAEEVAPAVSGE